ncbi:carboxymuconolactone decarboxylase family protein [Streptomyces sp. NBC_00631]|uniref:carboxymuconolactone decarboxylase family protein n=1 Tax=Streptomyces sp. NBC_00631 TaxID=2975793 RepID=UPI0030E0CB95
MTGPGSGPGAEAPDGQRPQRLAQRGRQLPVLDAARRPGAHREGDPAARGRLREGAGEELLAASGLTPEAYRAAKSAAAVMAMNNVFRRTRHLLSDHEYGTLRAGLRMNVIANPGVDKVDFELWSFAVSAINGCGMCLDSHEQVPRRAGVDREVVQEAFKIASVVQAVGSALEAEAVLAGFE